MDRRPQLQTLLKSLMVNPTDPELQLGKVYFQAETDTNRVPPYIVYDQDQARNKFADNIPYRHTKRWSIEIVDTDADSKIPDKVAALPMSTFQRRFKTAGLYHTIYSLYF